MPHTFAGVRERLSSPGYLPPHRRGLWSMSGGRCFWCDRTMNLNGDWFAPGFMTIDHVHTKQSGLPRELKIAACRSCNSERGGMTAEEYWQVWAQRLNRVAA